MGALLDIARKAAAIGEAHEPKAADALPDLAAEARRQKALAMLAANSAMRLAVVCDGDGDPVPVAVAIRDKGRARY